MDEMIYQKASIRQLFLTTVIDFPLIFCFDVLLLYCSLPLFNLYPYGNTVRIIGVFISAISTLCYTIFLPFYWNGKTVGRNTFGIKLISMNGNLTFIKIFFRQFFTLTLFTFLYVLHTFIYPRELFFKYFEVYTIFIFALVVIFQKQHRSVSDLLFGTRVVQESNFIPKDSN